MGAEARSSTQSEADRLRRVLQKSLPAELLQGELLDEALQLAVSPTPGTTEQDLLAFLAVLFRQLRAALTRPPNSPPTSEPTHLIDRIYQNLASVLLPDGSISKLILTKIHEAIRPNSLRAVDALTAAARFAEVLPAPSTSSSSGQGSILAPLFLSVVNSGTTDRTNLLVASILIEVMPSNVLPQDLYDNLLRDLNTTDGASTRCGILANLLSRRRNVPANATEEDKDRYMMAPLVPLLQERSSASSQLVDRYLLPAIFKRHPKSVLSLLDMLDRTTETNGVVVDTFPAWITVAALGVNNRVIDISDLPLSSLNDAIAHAEDTIRLRAFQIITNAKNLLSEDTLELVKQSLLWNEVLPSASGRTDLASAVHAFFTQLTAAQAMARKAIVKDPSKASSLDAVESFHQWFLEDFVNPALGSARRHPAIRAMFILKLLRLYLDLFPERKSHIFNAERIDLLIGCQASEFTDTRIQARQIIELAPSPMPGYETMQSVAAQTLFASALASLNHPRKTQAEAGRAALCIIFTKIVQTSDDSSHVQSLRFVGELADLLEQHLVQVERELAVGIVENPLHGPLSALSDIISYLSVKTPEQQAIWKPLLHRLFDQVNRVWRATRPVISLTSAEASSAAHEIARAYEVLAEGDDGEGDDAMDHTNLLSGCWRAVKEAADLLSAILILPLKQDGASQCLWAIDEIKAGGSLFLTWMHEIRHRGTFSRIAPALGQLVEVIRSIPDLRPLVVEWLEQELETIASDQHSTTRRSAALPYSVLAIVTGDVELLDKAVDQLVNLARVSNAASSDVTKVHAMNVLKTVLLDARQTKALPKYLEKAVMVALEAFTSNNWNVRNVGLLLFSTLINRSLSSGRGQDIFQSRTTLNARQSLASWQAKYPRIIPYVRDFLDTSRKAIPKSAASAPSLGSHSPLFPILNILRSLRWSQEGQELADSLAPLVGSFLSSPEWQVRTVAAQALSSFVSPKAAMMQAIGTCSTIQSTASPNEVNGLLLFLHRIISDVLDVTTDRFKLERGLLSILQRRYQSPLNAALALDCATAYLRLNANASSTIREAAKIVATQTIGSPASQPGHDLLISSCAGYLLMNNEPTALATALSSSCEELRLAALDKVDPAASVSPEVVSALLRLGLSSSAGDLELAQAFELISRLPKAPEITSLDKLCDRATRLVTTTKCAPLREASLMAFGWAITSSEGFVTKADQLAKWIAQVSHEDMSEPSRFASVVCVKHIASYMFSPSQGSLSTAQIALQKSLLRLLQDDDPDIRTEAASIVTTSLGVGRPVAQLKALKMWWSWLQREVANESDRDAWEPWLVDLAINQSTYQHEISRMLSRPQDRSGILFEEEPNNIFRDDLVDARFATETLIQWHRPRPRASGDSGDARHHHEVDHQHQHHFQLETTMDDLEREYERAVRQRQEREGKDERGGLTGVSPIDDAWDARWSLQQRIDIQRKGYA